MRFISWNINGIRSLKSNLKYNIEQLNADVICFQEVKISRNQIDESIAFVPGYYSFFAFPKYISGYSGVATYCRTQLKPSSAYDSLLNQDFSFSSQLFNLNEIKSLENEGRILITKHIFKTISNQLISLYVFNLYCPRSDPEKPERSIYKLNFHRLIEEELEYILNKNESNHVLILSDLNISHKKIDHCEPEDDFEQNPFRQWLDNFFSISCKKKYYFVDVFRHFYPDSKNMFTCWNLKTGARQNNYGTRIDFAICDSNFLKYIQDCQINSNILGSDHCPVILEIKNLIPQPASFLPSLCTQNWPEFGSGKKQTSILDYVFEKRKNMETFSIQNQLEIQSTQAQKKVKTKDIKNYFKPLKESKQIKKIEDLSESFQVDLNKIQIETEISSNQDVIEKWKKIFQGQPKPPLCTGHQEECKLNRVNKAGPNKGKQFWCCPKAVGFKDDSNSQCDFFRWLKK